MSFTEVLCIVFPTWFQSVELYSKDSTESFCMYSVVTVVVVTVFVPSCSVPSLPVAVDVSSLSLYKSVTSDDDSVFP